MGLNTCVTSSCKCVRMLMEPIVEFLGKQTNDFKELTDWEPPLIENWFSIPIPNHCLDIHRSIHFH